MHRYDLADDTSNRLAPLFPGTVGDRGRTARDIQLFLDAIHFMAHNGGPWRDLPPLPEAVATLRPVALGVPTLRTAGQDRNMAAPLRRVARPESRRAALGHHHRSCSCARSSDAKKEPELPTGADFGDAAALREALGSSRGGRISTKIHALIKALGCAPRARITAGHHADVGYAGAVLAGLSAYNVVTDRGYNAAWQVDRMASKGSEAVIPSL